MKTLVQVLLLIILAGCASPYRAVYTSAEGDYYIEERSTQSGYYVPGSVIYADIGFDPWWITANPSLAFIYYNPNYYQYYLSAWYRLIYQPYYGYYGGYYPYWCPPHRIRHGHSPAYAGEAADPLAPAPLIDGRELTDRKDLWRPVDNKGVGRVFKQGNGATYKAIDQTRLMKAFTNAAAKPAQSTPAIGSNRSAAFASPSPPPRSVPVENSIKMSGLSRVRNKQ
jgi:hypothetical protein